MTPQELKNSILQLAIQGKLAEQRPEEGTAEELYQRIQEEKRRLIKAGKLKKEKPLPEITEDEKPFEIPENWKWVRLGNILRKLVDGTHRTPKYTTSGIPFVSVRNISSGKLSLADTKFISEEEHKLLFERCNPEKDDILLSKVGTTGVPAKVDTDAVFSLFVSVALLKFNTALIDIDFLIYAILTPDFQKQCKEHTRGVGNKNWVIADIANTVFPLPPLAEQKRIVAKIEELLPYIDRYEQAWSYLEDFNKRFPDDMKKSILQLAIQGKLVEQRPEEGDAEELYQQIQTEKQQLVKAEKIKKEKPLPEITENEKPFEIPESWKWVRLRSLGVFSSGKTPTMGIGANWDNGTVSWITSKDMKRKYLNSSEMLITEKAACEMKMYPANTILIVVRSGILKRFLPVAILSGESTINQDIKALSLYMPVIAEYVYIILKGMETYILKEYRKQVTTVDSLRFEDFQNMPVPLPPFAEQKRIVAKLEELLPLCERLK